MKISVNVNIDAPKEKVWKVITDFKNSVTNIEAITAVEILEEPKDSLIGFKWKETRNMFGKEASETMWITEAEENSYYQTRAENHGSVYISRLNVEENNGVTNLRMDFDGQPQSFGAKVMGAIFGLFFKGSMRKAVQRDLEDIKKVVESA